MPTAATIEQLISAVSQEKPDWEFVDNNKIVIANSETARRWAFEDGYKASNGDLRDLAMTLVEAGDYELTEEEKIVVQERLDDEDIYAGFRATFALFKRGDRSEKVMEKMRTALEDSDVKEIAENYLHQ